MNDFDTEFDISFGNVPERYHQPITDLQMALVRAGLLVKGGLVLADGTLLPFQMVKVLKYFVIDNTHLNSAEQQFNASAANTEGAQIIIEFAKEHPEIFRHFGKGIKKLLRKEYAPRNVPEALRIQHGRKAKQRPIYERVMHDQPIIAPMPEARVILERIRRHVTPPPHAPSPPLRHNIEHLPRRQR